MLLEPEQPLSIQKSSGEASNVADLAQREASADGLNHAFAARIAEQILDNAANRLFSGRIAMVSSFGTESVVLLHLLSKTAPDLPVIFIDTLYHFPETLEYQLSLTRHLGLKQVVRVQPDANAIASQDMDGKLHANDPDACCNLRKVQPLAQALTGYEAWITGRKRHQNAQRASIELFEEDAGRIKVNPLAFWSRDQLLDYITLHDLPRHPLMNRGYPSVGCGPCTSPASDDQDPRSGRWSNQTKTECGIHVENGKILRTDTQTPSNAAA